MMNHPFLVVRQINPPPLGAIINIPFDTPLLAAGQFILPVRFPHLPSISLNTIPSI
jgi:hypothetical protein